MRNHVEESTMTLESARPHLKNLAKVAASLNEASDKYTEELKTIEAELKKLNLGIEVCLNTAFVEGDWEEGEEDDEGRCETYYPAWFLGYGKHVSQWKLLVHRYKVTGSPGGQGSETYTLVIKTPLLDASRDLRIASANHITALLAKIEEEAKQKTEVLRKVGDTR